MKKMLILMVFFGLSSSMGAENSTPWAPSATLRTEMVSKYLGFANGSVISDRPAIQTDFCIPLPEGFRIGIWNSTGLDGSDPSNLGDEVDYYAGWTGTFEGFGVDVSFAYFDEPGIFHFGSCDILNPGVEINHPLKNGLVPFVKWVGYTTMPNSGFDGGNVFQFGTRYTFNSESIIKLPKFVSVPVQTIFAWDDGAFFSDPGVLWKGMIEANWHITKWLDVNAPCAAVYAPVTVDNKNPHGTDIVVYAGVTIRL